MVGVAVGVGVGVVVGVEVVVGVVAVVGVAVAVVVVVAVGVVVAVAVAVGVGVVVTRWRCRMAEVDLDKLRDYLMNALRFTDDDTCVEHIHDALALLAAMSSPRCETCRWWEQSGRDVEDRHGECRRFPPIARDADGDGVWCDTHFNDWCAEWSAREEDDE